MEILNKKRKKISIQVINLNDIILPIAISVDEINKMFQFRLYTINVKIYHLFRLKSQSEKILWCTNIESMWKFYNNFDQNYNTKKINDQTESCLIMLNG